MTQKIQYTLLLLLFFSLFAQAESNRSSLLTLGPDIKLLPNKPDQYTVKPGDTFLDVLNLFVVDPLLAKQLWGQSFPNVYPGDQVSIVLNDKQYALQIKQERTVKLSPAVKVIKQEREIPTIPTESVQQFFNRPHLITEEEVENAGYIVANNNRQLLATVNNQIYARGISELSDDEEYIIVRLGKPCYSEFDDDILAHEAIYLGDAKIEERGDPSILKITAASREIRAGDLLLPLEGDTVYQDFRPHIPEDVENGQIIAITGEQTIVGQYNIVIINKGLDDGIEAGHVLAINSHTKEIEDEKAGEPVLLPKRRLGILMVFKPFDRVSYALVMKSTNAISLFDEVAIP